MPKAQITSASPQDAEPLRQRLQSEGYIVEVVPPGTPVSDEVDLQLNLEVCDSENALTELIATAAAEDVDVYVAPGSLPVRTQAAPEQQTPVPAVAEPSQVMEEMNSLARELQRRRAQLAQSLWERRALQRRAREMERRQREPEHPPEHDAVASQHAQPQRVLGTPESPVQSAEPVERMQQEEAEQVIQLQKEEAAQALPVPMPVEPALAETMSMAAAPVSHTPRTTPRTSHSRSLASPRRAAPKRKSSRREHEWMMAGVMASILAIAATFGWALASYTRSESPLSPANLNRGASIQQQVPFGAVTIAPPHPVSPVTAATPKLSPAPAPLKAPATNRKTAQTAVGRTGNSKPSAIRDVRAPKSSVHRRSETIDSQGDVTVHYFRQSVPKSQSAQSTQLKRFSDLP